MRPRQPRRKPNRFSVCHTSIDTALGSTLSTHPGHAEPWGVFFGSFKTVDETFGLTIDTIDRSANAVPGSTDTDTVTSHTHDDIGMISVLQRLWTLACDARRASSSSTDPDTLAATAATSAATTTDTSAPAETNQEAAEHAEKATATKTTAAKTKTDDTTALITRALIVRDALAAVMHNPDRLNMQAGLDVMRQHAGMNEDLDRLAVTQNLGQCRGGTVVRQRHHRFLQGPPIVCRLRGRHTDERM